MEIMWLTSISLQSTASIATKHAIVFFCAIRYNHHQQQSTLFVKCEHVLRLLSRNDQDVALANLLCLQTSLKLEESD